MQRTTGPGAIYGLFVEEDIETGRPPTQITAAWMNSVQEEIATVIEEAAIELNSAHNNQLLAAINDMIATAISGGVSGLRAVPIGSIIAWSGSIADIPLHWALCDGTGGTPDLRGKFIIGAAATGTYTVGATGGTADAVIVAHTHTVIDPQHSHAISAINATIGSSGFTSPGGAYSPTDITTTDAASTGIIINSTGVSGTNKNLPPYYAFAYIRLMS